MYLLGPDLRHVYLEFPSNPTSRPLIVMTWIAEYICVLFLTTIILIMVQKKITYWFPIIDQNILDYAVRIRNDFFSTPLPSEDEFT